MEETGKTYSKEAKLSIDECGRIRYYGDTGTAIEISQKEEL